MPSARATFDAFPGLIVTNFPEREQLQRALAEIGFAPSRTLGMFEHPHSNFTIDFLKGPLAVGGDYIHETVTLERGAMRLRILTPTDCVRDRLAHFYHWDDYTALEAAVGVAQSHRQSIDVSTLRAWTEREGGIGSVDHRPKFQEFLHRSGLGRAP